MALLLTTLPAFATMPSDGVQVGGAVKTALTLRVEDLKAFPVEQISSLTVTRSVDGKDVSSTVRGVRLSAVLKRAQLLSTDRILLMPFKVKSALDVVAGLVALS